MILLTTPTLLISQTFHGFYKLPNYIIHDRINAGLAIDMGGYANHIVIGSGYIHALHAVTGFDENLMYFLRTDENGNTLVGGALRFEDPITTGDYFCVPKKIIRTFNQTYEEYAITGYVIDESDPDKVDILFMLIDGQTGTVTQVKRFDFTNLTSMVNSKDYGNSICQNLFGDFVIVGKAGNETDGYDMAVIEVNGLTSQIRISSVYDFDDNCIGYPNEVPNDVIQDSDPSAFGNQNIFHVVGHVESEDGNDKIPFILTMTQHIKALGTNLPIPGSIVGGEWRMEINNGSFTRIKKTFIPGNKRFVIIGHHEDEARPIFMNVDYSAISPNYPTSWARTFLHGAGISEIPNDIAEYIDPIDPAESNYLIIANKYSSEIIDDYNLDGMLCYKTNISGSIMNKTLYYEDGRAGGRAIDIDDYSNPASPKIVLMGQGINSLIDTLSNMIIVKSDLNGVAGLEGTIHCEYMDLPYEDEAYVDNPCFLTGSESEQAAEYDLYVLYEGMNEEICFFEDPIDPGSNRSTGVLKHSPKPVKVFPTQLSAHSDLIYITGLQEAEQGAIKCYNVLGEEVVFSKTFDQHNRQTSLRFTQNLPHGYYYISIQLKGSLHTYKFIKVP